MSSGPILVEIEDRHVQAALGALAGRLEHPDGLMAQIGEALVDSTKRRFPTSRSPSGDRWAPDRAVTITRYIQARYGKTGRAFSKHRTGALTKFGLGAAMVKRPLIGETKRLSSEIFYEAGSTEVRIGSSLKYAAAQQFGMKRGYAGRTRRGSPIPWGTIPPRPFLGVSSRDRETVLGLIRDWLAEGAAR
jgi:phage gpG-like protein